MSKKPCYRENIFHGDKRLSRCPIVKRPKEHYGQLDDTEHQSMKRPDGLFNFPEDMKGKTNWGERKFVVFYFDHVEDYEKIVKALSIKTTKEHPHMDSKKLLELINEKE